MLKKPLSAPEGPGKSDEEIEEAAIQHLADLALQFAAAQRRGTTSADLTQAQADCQRLLRKTLAQDQDDILYEALDRCRYADIDAYLWLKDAIEEAASVALIRGQAGQQFEINAFLIPLFAHSTGGLERDKNFQNQQAFDRLTKSFTEAGLESPTARVVLVNHAYPLEQIDRITYCQLSSMVREAYASMTNAKMAAAPAIAASIGEWQESDFGPEDSAIELRFLLGFALKTEDDPFYLPPADDAGSDAYFSAREKSFQVWTEKMTAIVQNCLGMDEKKSDVHFMYQDLFHGAKETAIAEWSMLEMMAQLNQGLQSHDLTAADSEAAMAIIEQEGDALVQVNLYSRALHLLLAQVDMPLAIAADLTTLLADINDALGTVGITAVHFADGFDANNQPLGLRPFELGNIT